MIRLAFSNDPDFVVSDVELKRSGFSYTIDTVRHFKSILPENTELYFYCGTGCIFGSRYLEII